MIERERDKKRPWFQIHLSTAVLLMFLVGLIMWANTTPKNETHHNEDGETFNLVEYGWPIPVYRLGTTVISIELWPSCFIVDAFTTLTFLIVIVYILEGRIKDQEAIKLWLGNENNLERVDPE